MAPMDAAAANHTRVEPAAPRLVVMLVHGTFAQGMGRQLQRNLKAWWARLRGRQPAEAELWPAPAAKADARWWFEAGSAFETKLVELLQPLGLPRGSLAFERIAWSGRNNFADREAAATTLREALAAARRGHPGLPIVVVAHSHGGTVAVKALDARHPACPTGVQALLTLGSPFVRLTERAAPPPLQKNGERAATFKDGVAALLPGTLLALAPLAAVAQGWLASGPAGLGLAIALGLLGAWAAFTASVITAYLIVVALLLLGGGALWSFIPGLAIVALMAPLFIFKNPLAAAGWRHVERGPLWLACPMLALRTPRDEASLVIGLGQVAQGLGQWGARLVGLFWRPVSERIEPASKDPAPPSRPRRALRGLAVGLATVLVVLAVGGLAALQAQGFEKLGAGWGGWWSVGVASAGYGTTLLLLIPLLLLLAWAVPTAAISLAAGREAFMLPAVTIVEAEPLPHAVGADGKQAASMALEILYEAQLTGLNHSLYEAKLVQQRIAVWLRAQLEPAPD
jgi:hypothetical protein